MKNIILDSCVAVKFFIEEKDSADAVGLLEYCVKANISIIAPGIVEYELLQIAIRYGENMGDAIAYIENHIFNMIDIHPMNYKTWLKAGEIAGTGHTKSGYPSLYGSAYHAMAIESNGLFITADKKHYEKSRNFGHIALLSDWEKAIKAL